MPCRTIGYPRLINNVSRGHHFVRYIAILPRIMAATSRFDRSVNSHCPAMDVSPCNRVVTKFQRRTGFLSRHELQNKMIFGTHMHLHFFVPKKNESQNNVILREKKIPRNINALTFQQPVAQCCLICHDIVGVGNISPLIEAA